MELEKRDWKKIVNESNGKRILLPSLFEKEAKKCDAMRVEYNQKAVEMGKKKFEMDVAFQNMFLAIMKYLADTGRADIWAYDIGLDADALKEGIFVINIDDRQPK